MRPLLRTIKTSAMALALFPIVAWTAQEEEVSANRPAEYMIYQYPGVSLVVKIDADEVEFESRITGPDNALIMDSAVPFRRIGPVYQLISPTDIPRQLMIKVTPGRKIDRSRISMELIQLSGRDSNSQALAQAYGLLSIGTEQIHERDKGSWASKAYSLRDASRSFAALGMEEMRLWSEYYAAHLALYRLNDVLSAIEMVSGVGGAARRAGFEKIELASLVLLGDALMLAEGKSSNQGSTDYLQDAHALFEALAALAGKLGLDSERGRALYNDGLAYEKQGNADKAIERYQQALDVTLTTDDLDLANDIRATAAAAYETRGQTSGAIEMLDDIAGDLGDSREPGQDREAAAVLAGNLFEKGRLLNSNFRFEEAALVLAEALAVSKSSGAGAWGPAGLELGWSQYSSGHWEQAAATITESLPRTPRKGNTEILFRAYGSLAAIARDSGYFGQMEQYREMQGSLTLTGDLRARHLFGQAMDAWRRDGARSSTALDKLRQSRRAAADAGAGVLEKRVSLHLCLSLLERGGGGDCARQDGRAAYRDLMLAGIPGLALESRVVFSRIELLSGMVREALARLTETIGDVRFYQSEIRGVLGAWYWENKEGLFRAYLSAVLNDAMGNARKSARGAPVLLALEQVRLIENSESRYMDYGNSPQEEAFRALLARRVSATGREAQDLARELNRQIRDRKQEFDAQSSILSQEDLANLLSGLGSGECVVSYYFGERSVYALLGKSGGVSVARIGSSEQIRLQLQALRDSLPPAAGADPVNMLEELGETLLRPLSDAYTRRLFLLSAGPVTGFPFDILRFNGRYLSQDHEVVMLRSLSSLGSREVQLILNGETRVFLAGNPQVRQDMFSYGVSTSAEILAVRDRFIGPGLHIVQGVALQGDEFTDARFSRADLMHLAIPGTADLAFPERSKLSLSGPVNDSMGGYLRPANLREFEYSARLAVLSNLAISGDSTSVFSNRLGFVSDLMDQGVRSVIVSTWPAQDAELASFMGRFYANLERTPDVIEALKITRLEQISQGGDGNLSPWAGFQLHIR